MIEGKPFSWGKGSCDTGRWGGVWSGKVIFM